MLPADHGLDPHTTWVGVVQTFGLLFGLPKRLSDFTATPLQAPPPLLLGPDVLVGGGGTDSASSSNSSNVGGGGASSSSSPDSATQSDQQRQPQRQLRLVECEESTHFYTAKIKLVSSTTSTSSSSPTSSSSSPLPDIDARTLSRSLKKRASAYG